jgi:transcriptional regulator with XRE-family HTH domain
MGLSQSEGFVKRVVEVLKEERLRQGMSHEKLAEAAGVHRSTVSRTESGKMSPTLYVVYSMASVLKLDMAVLMKKAQSNGK